MAIESQHLQGSASKKTVTFETGDKGRESTVQSPLIVSKPQEGGLQDLKLINETSIDSKDQRATQTNVEKQIHTPTKDASTSIVKRTVKNRRKLN